MTGKINNTYLKAQINVLKKSARDHRNNTRPGQRRFWMYGYLKVVYAVFRTLKTQGVSKKSARRIVKRLKLPIKLNSHLIRVLIEVSAGPEDNRTKIKWANALRYAFGWLQQPERLEWFFQVNKGISGCATMQAINDGTSRKKSRKNSASSERPFAQSASMPMQSSEVAACDQRRKC